VTTDEHPVPGAGKGARRRTFLSALPLGMLAGVGLTQGIQWVGSAQAGRVDVSAEDLRHYLGSDLKGARSRALTLWQRRHNIGEGSCVDLSGAGPAPDVGDTCVDRSVALSGGGSPDPDAELRATWDALTRDQIDLAVIDAQYLHMCTAKGLVARIDSIDPQDLRARGIPEPMVDACRSGDALYGLPVNADAPMLVVNQRLVPKGTVEALTKASSPRGFWETLAKSAGPKQRIGIELGDYEGGTVVLLELLTAHGLDPKRVLDPDALRAPLAALRESLFAHRDRFDLDGLHDGTGQPLTEDHVSTAFAGGRTAFARLWPAFAHDLAGSSDLEVARVPVPGGVRGGQVLVVAARARNREAAEDAALFLQEDLSQFQMFTEGGYLPVNNPLYKMPALQDFLSDRWNLEKTVGRPVTARYTDWSAVFRTVITKALLAPPSPADQWLDATDVEKLRHFRPGTT
jgi:hypothetical protein